MNGKIINKDNPVVAWWSGGVTSAVTCKLCIEWLGSDNVRIIFIDTKNEDEDTYRFKNDCERWYLAPIETISNPDFSNIQEVWYKNVSLNVAHGAKCSQMLKRIVRERWQRENKFSYQAFGFDTEEVHRARSMKLNHPASVPIFPLISELLRKKECIKIIEAAKIEIPATYRLGYQNNNCWKTGCVQGGIGYWQKIKKEFPDKFDNMAKVEHDLTDLRGSPVTMLKDQSKGGGLVFLKPHPKYPNVKDISMMRGREVAPLVDCNGFCGTNDLQKAETEEEINYAD